MGEAIAMRGPGRHPSAGPADPSTMVCPCECKMPFWSNLMRVLGLADCVSCRWHQKSKVADGAGGDAARHGDDDVEWKILQRWFTTVRCFEQAHNDSALLWSKRNSIFTTIVVVLNAFAALFSNWPGSTSGGGGASGDADAQGNCSEQETSLQSVSTATVIVSVMTIVVTGASGALGPAAEAKAHTIAARSFRDLLLRFEGMVNQRITYLKPSAEAAATEAQSLRAAAAAKGDTGALVAERRADKWKDWEEDFRRSVNEAPLIHRSEWDHAKRTTRCAEVIQIMEKQLAALYAGPSISKKPQSLGGGQPRIAIDAIRYM
jgi:hypothetical protein